MFFSWKGTKTGKDLFKVYCNLGCLFLKNALVGHEGPKARVISDHSKWPWFEAEFHELKNPLHFGHAYPAKRSAYAIQIWIYTTWKLDGTTPMYWFIMAPYFQPPFGSGDRHLLSPRCVNDKVVEHHPWAENHE